MRFKGKILLDENLPFELLTFFIKRGISVEHIKKIGKQGLKNGEIYKYAERNKKWIITKDSDFQNYLKYLNFRIGGIILLKIAKSPTNYLMGLMEKFWNKYSIKLKKKYLVIIEDNKVTFIR